MTQPHTTPNCFPSHMRQRTEWNIYVDAGKQRSNRTISLCYNMENPHVNCIEKAFLELVNRHESLRTTLFFKEGKLWQQIHEMNSDWVKMDYYDVSDSLLVEKSFGKNLPVDQIVKMLLETSFDIEEGPLVKCTLLKISHSSYKFIFVVHHIIADGESVELLEREFNVLYSAYVSGQKPELAPMKYQLKDYAIWEKEFFSQAKGKANVAYWDSVFRTPIPTIKVLPAWRVEEHSPSQNPDSERKGYRFVVGEEKLRKLDKMIRKLGTFKLSFYLASLYAFVYYLTGERDLTIGSQLSNRDNVITKNLVGYLTVGIHLRVELQERLSGQEFVIQVGEVYLEALEHRTYSWFDVSVEFDSACPMNLDYFPEYTKNNTSMRGFDSEFILGIPNPHYPMNFMFVECKDGLAIYFHHQNGFCDNAKLPQMFEAYDHIFNRLLDAPELSIEEILRETAVSSLA